MEGNLRFKIDWVSLIVGRKFTVFVFLFFVLHLRAFPSRSPPGAYIRRDDLTEHFSRYECGRLIFGGAYFRNFKVFRERLSLKMCTRQSRKVMWDMINTLFLTL